MEPYDGYRGDYIESVAETGAHSIKTGRNEGSDFYD